MLRTFALQASLLAAAAAWQAYMQDAPHLYITAAIALVFKAIVIPVALHRIVISCRSTARSRPCSASASTMIVGVGLVALSILLVLPVTASPAPSRARIWRWRFRSCCSACLMMITRRNAVTQVVGFMSLENGLILAAVGVRGMPFVVEMSVAFSVMVAFIIFGIFFFHIRERFDTLDLHYLETFRGERE